MAISETCGSETEASTYKEDEKSPPGTRQSIGQEGVLLPNIFVEIHI